MSGRGMGRGVVLYSLASILAIGLAAGVFIAVYTGGMERRAVAVSAVLALVVQVASFALARLLAERGNGIAGWGVGAMICFAALIVYGFASRALGLPSTPAMLSLATFFFLTELIEPPLLTV